MLRVIGLDVSRNRNDFLSFYNKRYTCVQYVISVYCSQKREREREMDILFNKFYFTAIVYPGTLAFILTVFVPDVLDVVAPLDKPRPRDLPVKLEFFIDKEKYFYLITVVFILCAFLGMTVLMATETMFMLFTQHACGLYELIR